MHFGKSCLDTDAGSLPAVSVSITYVLVLACSMLIFILKRVEKGKKNLSTLSSCLNIACNMAIVPAKRLSDMPGSTTQALNKCKAREQILIKHTRPDKKKLKWEELAWVRHSST